MKNLDNSKTMIAARATLLSAAFALFIDLIWAIWAGIKINLLDNWGLEPTGLVGIVYAAFWAMYLLPTQSTFAQTSKKRNALNAAIRAGDKEKFIRYVDLQISWITDLMFMVICCIILLMTFLIKSELLEGLIIVSIISWTMMFVRIIYLVRDNPIEGAWFFSPFQQFIRIGIWELECLDPKWRTEVLTRKPTDCQIANEPSS